MPEIDPSRRARLKTEILPKLGSVRKRWGKVSWLFITGSVVLPTAGVDGVLYYLQTMHYLQNVPAWVPTVVGPAMGPLVKRFWAYDDKLRQFAIAIRAGDHDSIMEATTDLGFHYPNLKEVIEDVDRILGE